MAQIKDNFLDTWVRPHYIVPFGLYKSYCG